MTTKTSAPDMEDPDPIKASYDVYVNPHLPDGRKLYILQFPNRQIKYNYSDADSSLPTEFRVKSKSQIFEMDVPFDAWHNYDRTKGVKWGEAVRKTTLSRGNTGGGGYGLPGGFGISAAHPGRLRAAHEEDEITQADIEHHFGRLITEQKVLMKQTLGGQSVPKESTTPQYMIGAFRKNQLHLTPVDQIVHMRPQFHHIDAQVELDRLGRPRETTQTSAGQGPRAIHMTVKATAEGEEETTDTMAERIRAAQDEPWKRLRYVDEDSSEAWEAFESNLFVENMGSAPKLVSSMANADYLDAISAPRNAAKLSRSKKVRLQGGKDDSSETMSGDEEAVGNP